MKVHFNIEEISVFGISLPVANTVFKEFETFLPDNLKNAAIVRKEEFVAGRFCAVQAAKNIGLALNALPSSASRAPMWPDGIIGSISHSKKLAISCVSKPEAFDSVGIDAEEILSQELDIQDTIASPAELSLIRSNFRLGLTVIFSAKEAFYKALYPKVKCFIDFKEVELVKIDLQRGDLELKLTSHNPLLSPYRGVYQGHFQLHDDTVISLVTIPVKNEGSSC